MQVILCMFNLCLIAAGCLMDVRIELIEVPLSWFGIGHGLVGRVSWILRLCSVIINCAVLVLYSFVGKIGCSERMDWFELAAF